MKSVRLLIVFLVAVAAWVVPGWASDRVALVIGNNDYESAERLYSPVNDANDMAATLRELGFDVIERTNLTRQAMDQVIEEFKLAIQPGGVGLFYFSGHGVQLEGANYLIPVDASLYAEEDVRYKSVHAELILDKMERSGSRMNIMILDACRNDPFKSFHPSAGGLAPMSAPAGSFIAYATGAGELAWGGGTNRRNSLYTGYLLDAIQEPGAPIETVFKNVRQRLMVEAGSMQTSWESSSIVGDFYFRPASGALDIGQTLAPLPDRAPAFQPSEAEETQGFVYRFTNECHRPIRLAIYYKDLSETWQTQGWWTFEPNETAVLGAADNSLRSTNSIWYYYAETENADITWTGPYSIEFEGQTLGMKKMQDAEGVNNWSIGCDGQ